jgi:hypothetical protein
MCFWTTWKWPMCAGAIPLWSHGERPGKAFRMRSNFSPARGRHFFPRFRPGGLGRPRPCALCGQTRYPRFIATSRVTRRCFLSTARADYNLRRDRTSLSLRSRRLWMPSLIVVNDRTTGLVHEKRKAGKDVFALSIFWHGFYFAAAHLLHRLDHAREIAWFSDGFVMSGQE